MKSGVSISLCAVSIPYAQMACPSENVLYVAGLLKWRAQKLLLLPR